MPFIWTVNPYRGCEFGCKYCYARYTHEFMELRGIDDFETEIYAKQWHAPRFAEELRRIDPAETIAIGTATDPYQPAERRFELTRKMLSVFAQDRGRRIFLIRKSRGKTRCRSRLRSRRPTRRWPGYWSPRCLGRTCGFERSNGSPRRG